MYTTTKKYTIRLHLDRVISGCANDGIIAHTVRCKSVKGAEREAKVRAEIIQKVANVTQCEIEYQTKTGKVCRTVCL